MKTNLNRFLVLVAFATFHLQSFSQIYCIRGGFNMANNNHWIGSPKTMMFGINIGGTAEFEISDKYSIETGIIWNHKGYKYIGYNEPDITTRLRYIDIPINVKYRFDLTRNKLYLFAGPYIGFGIFGRYEWKDQNNELYADKVIWGNNGDNNEINWLDYGINLGTEYEFRSYSVGLQYGSGFANIQAGKPFKNRVFSLYLAYSFGKK